MNNNDVCPWCYELYDKVDHGLGCPDPLPDDKLSDESLKLKRFNEIMFNPWKGKELGGNDL